MERRKVAVIGAGAAGLVAAKRFSTAGWNVSVFEQTDTIGGTWVYTDEVGTQDEPIHTSMYKNLRTNLTKNVMAYLDFDFPHDFPQIMSHEQVLEYLHSYSKKFHLNQYIRFNHTIVLVEPLNEYEPLTGRYLVTWEVFNKLESEEFDFVIVCNGHNAIPYTPGILGIEHFRGKILHSHDYRNPEMFQNQSVLVIGSGYSAMDISKDLQSSANMVHLSVHEYAMRNSSFDKLQYHSSVVQIFSNGDIMFRDKTIVNNIDTIIFCTGFHLKCDFLSEKLGLTLKFKRICNLFAHIFPILSSHPQYSYFQKQKEKTIPPSIAFIGLPMGIIPFPLFDNQVQYVERIWNRKCYLPSISRMSKIMKHEQSLRKKSGLPSHMHHALVQGQYQYCKELQQNRFELEETPSKYSITINTNYLLIGTSILCISLSTLGFGYYFWNKS